MNISSQLEVRQEQGSDNGFGTTVFVTGELSKSTSTQQREPAGSVIGSSRRISRLPSEV